MSGPTRYNKKGMFECGEIRNNIVKPYLRDVLKVDPMGQNPLPDINDLPPIDNLRLRVENIMKWHGYKSGPWFYKGAKMCLIFPLWMETFPDAKWLIVRRKDEDIINSCMKTGFMRAYKKPEGWQTWIDVHKKRFGQMKAMGMEVKEVWPTKFVEGDFGEIKEAIEWLGLEWKPHFVKDFIDPKLWRTNNGK